MVSAPVHLVLVFVLAHLVNEVPQREIERTVFVFAVGFGSVRMTGARQSELHAVAADETLARVMPANRDLQILRLGIELGDFDDLVVYVTPKTVGNFDVTSDDVQLHGDLLKVSVPPTERGGFFRARVDMTTR
jgi:hypothetical protein